MSQKIDLINATIEIKDHCANIDCEDCVFHCDKYGGCMFGHLEPVQWEIPDTGDPDVPWI